MCPSCFLPPPPPPQKKKKRKKKKKFNFDVFKDIRLRFYHSYGEAERTQRRGKEVVESLFDLISVITINIKAMIELFFFLSFFFFFFFGGGVRGGGGGAQKSKLNRRCPRMGVTC